MTVSCRSLAIRSRSSTVAKSATRACRRAFSMAIPAADANPTASSSSTSVNTSPPALSHRYKLPNTLPRTATGTPRNDVICGWFGGKPKRSGCSRRSGRRSGFGSTINNPRMPCPSGRSPIASRPASSIPTVMKSDSRVPRLVEHTQRPISGVDDVCRGLDDRMQHRVQIEVRADGQHPVEQLAQLSWAGHVFHVRSVRDGCHPRCRHDGASRRCGKIPRCHFASSWSTTTRSFAVECATCSKQRTTSRWSAKPGPSKKPCIGSRQHLPTSPFSTFASQTATASSCAESSAPTTRHSSA